MILRSERIPFSNYTTMQVGLPQRKVRKQTENEFRGFVYLISKKLEKQTLLGIELQKNGQKLHLISESVAAGPLLRMRMDRSVAAGVQQATGIGSVAVAA